MNDYRARQLDSSAVPHRKIDVHQTSRFLDEGLRLRTACDFRVVEELTATAPHGFAMLTTRALKEALPG